MIDESTVRAWLAQDWGLAEAAVAALAALGPAALCWGLLHTDPAPELFRLETSSGR